MGKNLKILLSTVCLIKFIKITLIVDKCENLFLFNLFRIICSIICRTTDSNDNVFPIGSDFSFNVENQPNDYCS